MAGPNQPRGKDAPQPQLPDKILGEINGFGLDALTKETVKALQAMDPPFDVKAVLIDFVNRSNKDGFARDRNIKELKKIAGDFLWALERYAVASRGKVDFQAAKDVFQKKFVAVAMQVSIPAEIRQVFREYVLNAAITTEVKAAVDLTNDAVPSLKAAPREPSGFPKSVAKFVSQPAPVLQVTQPLRMAKGSSRPVNMPSNDDFIAPAPLPKEEQTAVLTKPRAEKGTPFWVAATSVVVVAGALLVGGAVKFYKSFVHQDGQGEVKPKTPPTPSASVAANPSASVSASPSASSLVINLDNFDVGVPSNANTTSTSPTTKPTAAPKYDLEKITRPGMRQIAEGKVTVHGVSPLAGPFYDYLVTITNPGERTAAYNRLNTVQNRFFTGAYASYVRRFADMDSKEFQSILNNIEDPRHNLATFLTMENKRGNPWYLGPDRTQWMRKAPVVVDGKVQWVDRLQAHQAEMQFYEQCESEMIASGYDQHSPGNIHMGLRTGDVITSKNSDGTDLTYVAEMKKALGVNFPTLAMSEPVQKRGPHQVPETKMGMNSQPTQAAPGKFVTVDAVDADTTGVYPEVKLAATVQWKGEGKSDEQKVSAPMKFVEERSAARAKTGWLKARIEASRVKSQEFQAQRVAAETVKQQEVAQEKQAVRDRLKMKMSSYFEKRKDQRAEAAEAQVAKEMQIVAERNAEHKAANAELETLESGWDVAPEAPAPLSTERQIARNRVNAKFAKHIKKVKKDHTGKSAEELAA